MDMICFLKPDTLEMRSAMGESYIYGDTDEFNQEIYEKVDKCKKFIRIDTAESLSCISKFSPTIANIAKIGSILN